MSPESPKPQPCYCCRQPLTYVRKPAAGSTTPPDPASKEGFVESWECMNPECITWRQKHPKIPTPPLSK